LGEYKLLNPLTAKVAKKAQSTQSCVDVDFLCVSSSFFLCELWAYFAPFVDKLKIKL